MTCTLVQSAAKKVTNIQLSKKYSCSIAAVTVNNITSFNIQLVGSHHLYRYLKNSDSDSSDSESN